MIGILGGTFDPIHYGHLRPAQEVQCALALAEVRVIPAAQPPHRPPPVATVAQRFRMVELACAEFPGFHADDCEIRRGGPSYTVLTLEALRAEVGDHPLCLFMGADAFKGLETWHQWRRIPELAHVVVMTRPGWVFPHESELPPWVRGCVSREVRDLAQTPAGKIFYQAVTPQDISATRLREAIGRGEPIPGWLSPAVWEYINVNEIYRKRGN
jgi:nicotinate-nucleotide adenylyltransferase